MRVHTLCLTTPFSDAPLRANSPVHDTINTSMELPMQDGATTVRDVAATPRDGPRTGRPGFPHPHWYRPCIFLTVV